MPDRYLLIAILIVATVLRIVNLGVGDVTGNDETLYAFRSVGMLDFNEAEFQTTPLEWQDPNIQWWTALSFHDHPPLVFVIQNLFMKVFGENTFAFRLPSAILGIFSVYLLYLIGTQLFSKKVGLIAAAIMAITVNHVYISRIGIQESYVIFFLLLASYLFFKALENERYLLWTGAAIGFGILTKYNVFILAPIFLTYLVIFKRSYFAKKSFWLGALLALLIFSPVIVYNIQLYRTTGHFDFQISYILGQNPNVWQQAPGKEEIGALTDRIKNFAPNFVTVNSWPLTALFVISLTTLLRKKNIFPVLAIGWLILLLLLIGPTTRFLTMLTPFVVLSIAIFIDAVYEKIFVVKKNLALAGLALFLFWEIFYSVNSQILSYPVGPELWAFSKLRYDNYNWGYHELDKYLEKEFAGKFPALTFDMRYQFLNNIKSVAIEKARLSGLQSYSALIIYDQNIKSPVHLWSLDRLQIYHGWPVLKTEEYLSALNENGNDWPIKSGIKTRYFIIPTDKVPFKTKGQLTQTAIAFEQKLIADGIVPVSIYNRRGEESIKIYKF